MSFANFAGLVNTRVPASAQAEVKKHEDPQTSGPNVALEYVFDPWPSVL